MPPRLYDATVEPDAGSDPPSDCLSTEEIAELARRAVVLT